ncbi:MAG: hypothetical protein LC775_05535, partial [Acidobacteria bacterium]|nr:hypothetical protein [Acidobacteriota bacterium]
MSVLLDAGEGARGPSEELEWWGRKLLTSPVRFWMLCASEPADVIFLPKPRIRLVTNGGSKCHCSYA